MLPNHSNGLHISREAFPFTEAQNVQARWLPAVVFVVCSSAASWTRRCEAKVSQFFDITMVCRGLYLILRAYKVAMLIARTTAKGGGKSQLILKGNSRQKATRLFL